MNPSLLFLQGVRHTYKDAGWELSVPHFEVREREIVGVLGPNGSGKSTLLRIAAGTLKPVEGRVMLEGEDLRRMERRWIARRLGYLPQDIDSQFDYTVEEVVSMGRYAHLTGLGTFGARDLEVVHWSLQSTGIEQFRMRRLSHLSGGERQRTFLASVLAQEPRVLLLDEPTRGLDIHHQVGFFCLLHELARKGIGVAVVTHELNLAALYCDRLVLLSGGKLLREGLTDDVLKAEVLSVAYGPEIVMGTHPRTGRKVILPADVRGGYER